LDRRSITGYCILLGSSLAWKSKNKAAVSRSSTEAELRALATTTVEIVWLRWLLTDFGISCDAPTPLLCDNTGAIQIANDPIKLELTKHIGVFSLVLTVIRRQLIFSMYPLSCNWLIFQESPNLRATSASFDQTQCFRSSASTLSLKGGVKCISRPIL
jgi:hypothetical protein